MKSLFIKQFVDEGLGNSSYPIASEGTGIAAVIDLQRDIDKYVQTADGLGLKLRYALEQTLCLARTNWLITLDSSMTINTSKLAQAQLQTQNSDM
jgi:hypothetical protein